VQDMESSMREQAILMAGSYSTATRIRSVWGVVWKGRGGTREEDK
jgi:hypothetical protein